ncbi:hypothetical protein CHY_0084 [Carboxydothermus hydrogenoformans Z-2901]|uniref:Uncharacterized protein n=1 Tax=Carboxydothermus hydrogenoformans (strain ATCC BAA-161 / DSM 6008 / Z-2901) TaxID=246194 RepID=Q3AFX8_CARHZ|nr:hypothetical protein CHY_0084 [Carboxydothermus hydrogenoformans Z-2901]
MVEILKMALVHNIVISLREGGIFLPSQTGNSSEVKLSGIMAAGGDFNAQFWFNNQ